MTINREIVLNSGVFARVRKLTLEDLISSHCDNLWVMHLALIHRAVIFDGESWSIEKIASMELEELMPIMRAINEDINLALKSKGIA